MVGEKPIGWLIQVKGGSHGARRVRFAVLANALQRAKVLVGIHVAVTNQRVEFDRTLKSGEAAHKESSAPLMNPMPAFVDGSVLPLYRRFL
jgi:hypothetical protein